MVGLEVGVLAPLGNRENRCLSWWPVCDIRRVLITQMGFVTIVLLAPAMMDDQKLITKVFSTLLSICSPDPNQCATIGETFRTFARRTARTVILAHPSLALVIDGKPYCPCWQVTQYYRTETSVHAAQALVFPDNAGGAEKTIVQPGLTDMTAILKRIMGTLSLQFRLDDIKGTGNNARSEASYCASESVELRVRRAHSPALKGRQGMGIVGGHVVARRRRRRCYCRRDGRGDGGGQFSSGRIREFGGRVSRRPILCGRRGSRPLFERHSSSSAKRGVLVRGGKWNSEVLRRGLRDIVRRGRSPWSGRERRWSSALMFATASNYR